MLSYVLSSTECCLAEHWQWESESFWEPSSVVYKKVTSPRHACQNIFQVVLIFFSLSLIFQGASKASFSPRTWRRVHSYQRVTEWNWEKIMENIKVNSLYNYIIYYRVFIQISFSYQNIPYNLRLQSFSADSNSYRSSLSYRCKFCAFISTGEHVKTKRLKTKQ